MSLNTAHANGGVLIFAGERILIYYDGVEMGFDSHGVPQMKGNKKGRVYLTTHRVIFNSTNRKDALQSFSIPFSVMKGIELEQPVFGANYIKGQINAETYGNWAGTAKFKMWFNKGGAIEFGQAMLRAGQMAMASMRNRTQELPAYTAAPTGPVYKAQPPAYSPPQTDYYAWVPYQAFPNAPPPEEVYMTEDPPPYPGVAPCTPYPTPTAPQANGHDNKAREAAASAYYNPTAPHTAYMPATSSQPPSYNEATKKSN